MSETGGFDPIGPTESTGPAEPAEPVVPARKSRRLWVLAVVGVAVIASAGAGFAAGTAVGGGGTQPEDVLPDTVVAYVDLDLDPPAQQKLNLVRLLGQFGGVKREYGSEPDLRSVAVDWLLNGSALEDADVSAWVGDRVGLGVSWDPEAQELTPVAALQVTDEREAVSELKRVVEPQQVAVVDGYVVVTGDLFAEFDALDALDGVVGSDLPGSQSAADVVAAGQSAPLSASPAFTALFDRLDDGLVTMYVDGDRIAAAGEQLADTLGLGGPGLSDALDRLSTSGQAGAVIRAEPNALELLAWTSAAPPGGDEPARLTSGLPTSTLMAAETTGGSALVADRWSQLRGEIGAKTFDKAVADVEQQYSLTLPADLVTMAGDDAVLAVDGEGLLTGVPGVGLRSLTDPAAGADVATRLEAGLADLTGGFGITAEGTGDGFLVATTDTYAERLAAGDGGLGADPQFQAALPDAETATTLIWVNFAPVKGFAALAAPESAELIAPLQAFGFTISPDGGGSTIRARLVFDQADAA